MAEYRVTALIYRFVSLNEHDRFGKAVSMSGSLGDFDFTLEDAILKAVPRVEFDEETVARDALEPHLRDWEQSAFLSMPSHRIHFAHERSDFEDVDPKPNTTTLFVPTIVSKATAFPPTIVVENLTYPSPELGYVRTLLTDRLTERLRRMRDGEAELPPTADWVLTSIEGEFGTGRGSEGRRTAAEALAVDYRVLDKLGALAARADPNVGRKGKGDATPFTSAELTWMGAAVVRLIRRVGEHAAGETLNPLSMGDFPPLP